MKKSIVLITLLCIIQTTLQTPPPVNEPHLQELIDALANNDNFDQFIKETNLFEKYPPTDTLNLKNAIINTHQGATTLYDYAKQLNKTYFIDLIDVLIFIHELEDKNFQNLQEIINQPNFNPNNAISISMRSGEPSVTITLLVTLIEWRAPLDVIQSVLDKGASLTAKAGTNKQNWQVAVNVLENIEERTKKLRENINNLRLELQQTTDQNKKDHIKLLIEAEDTMLSSLQQNDLPYVIALIEMIERIAQQRGNKEVLEGIADAKQKLQIEI